MNTVTRHLCPLDDCSWHHDAHDPTADDLTSITPDPDSATFQEAVASVVEQSMMRQLGDVESALRAHFESHPLEQWVAALVGVRQERDRLAEKLRAAQDEKQAARAWLGINA